MSTDRRRSCACRKARGRPHDVEEKRDPLKIVREGLTEAQKATLRALGAREATLTSRTISSGLQNIFYFIVIALETIYTRNIFLLYINNGCDKNKCLT